MPMKPVSFIVKEETLRGYLHLPEGDDAVPCVVIFHGFTGNHLGSLFLFRMIADALAEKGVASLRFDFRGSGNSDGAFSDMRVSEEVRDGLAAVQFVRSLPQIDEARVALLGFSLGTIVASVVAERTGIRNVALLAPAAHTEKEARATYEQYRVGKNFVIRTLTLPNAYIEDYVAHNLIASISATEANVFIAHCEDDAVLPVTYAARTEKALAARKKGRKTVKVYEKGGHEFENGATRKKLIADVARFFGKALS